MRLLARIVPPGLEGTAQALYGTVGIGGATAYLTLVSGALYARVGPHGFWVMAATTARAAQAARHRLPRMRGCRPYKVRHATIMKVFLF
jgi:PPP family 3-phenylpropionic acid transporter